MDPFSAEVTQTPAQRLIADCCKGSAIRQAASASRRRSCRKRELGRHAHCRLRAVRQYSNRGLDDSGSDSVPESVGTPARTGAGCEELLKTLGSSECGWLAALRSYAWRARLMVERLKGVEEAVARRPSQCPLMSRRRQCEPTKRPLSSRVENITSESNG